METPKTNTQVAPAEQATKNPLVKPKSSVPEVKVLTKVEEKGEGSFMAVVESLSGGDKLYVDKFAAWVKTQVRNAWKTDAEGRLTNDFNLVPVSSVLDCLLTCARRKILPDGYNANLVVYKGKRPRVSVMIDYKGLIDCGIAEKVILDADAKEVRENDDIEINFGEVTKFSINPKKPRGEIIGCCAYAILPCGRRKTLFMDKEELDQVRACAQTDEVWGSWEVEMYKKTAIRRLFKTMRNSPRLNALCELDNTNYDLSESRPLASAKHRSDSPVRPVVDTIDVPVNEDEDTDRVAPDGEVW